MQVKSFKKVYLRLMFSGSALVDMYAKCGSLSESCVMFESFPFRGIVSLNAIVSGDAESDFREE